MLPRSDEGGSVHVLETTVIMIVMLSAVTTVIIMEDPPQGPFAPIENSLGRGAWEFLNIAADHPLKGGKCAGDDVLEQLMLDGFSGKEDRWEGWRNKFFELGTDASLFLDNGYDLMPLHDPSTFKGVADSLYIDPNDTFALTIPLVSTVSGLEDLAVSVPGVRDSALSAIEGEAIEFRVRYTEADIVNADRAAWGVTAVLNDTALPSTRAGVQDILWIDEGGSVLLSKSLSAQESAGNAFTGVALSLVGLPTSAGAPAPFPDGASIQIRFPRGWSQVSTASAGWTLTTQYTTSATWVTATKAVGTTATELTLSVKASPSTTRPFDVIHARVQGSSHGESSLLVTYPVTATTQRDLPRMVYPTAPYPMRAGSLATFGAAFANGGEAVTVTDVYITVPGGYDIEEHLGLGAELFAAEHVDVDERTWDPLLAPEGEGTWTRVSARQWHWHGARPVDALGTEYWVVGLRINPSSLSATSIEPTWAMTPQADVRFANGHEATSDRWGSVPGVVELSIPPDDLTTLSTADGYVLDLGVHEFTGTLEDGRRGIEDEASYRLLSTSADVTNVRSAVANSSLRARERLVPAGMVTQVDAELDSLATTLASLGIANAVVKVELYSPLTRGCPAKTIQTTLDSLPAPNITDVLLWDGGSPFHRVYAASGDGKVYRVQQGGLVLSMDHGGHSAILAHGEVSAVPLLFAGTDMGTVHAFHAETGARTWSKSLSSAGLPGVIKSLQFNETLQRVLVATNEGFIAWLDAANGDILDTGHPLSTIVHVHQHFDASIYVMGTTREISRIGADLETLAHRSFSENAPGFAVGQYVIIPQEHTYYLLDRTTLAYVGPERTYWEASPFATLAEPGDLDADGYDDLLVAMSNNLINVIDGATGTRDVIWPEDVTHIHAPYDTEVDQLDCRPTTFPNSYLTPLVCGQDWSASDGPSLLRTHGDRFIMSYIANGEPRLYVGQGNGGTAYGASTAAEVTAVGLGTWDTPVVAYGSASGIIAVHDEGTWGERVISSPSQRAGTSTFYFNIPRGGALGTHLVRLEISWDDAGKTQSANLYDWFQVVSPDGVPVLDPTYRIVLVVQDATLPHENVQGPGPRSKG